MKKSCLFISLLLLTSNLHATILDTLDLVGTYKCKGYDSHDGLIEHNMVISVDKGASNFNQHFAAYTFTAGNYHGYMAAQGDMYGFYFENTDAKVLNDNGVGIALITYDQIGTDKYQTIIHNSYYQPNYQRQKSGGRGNTTCVKL